MKNFREKANHIWSIADLLRGEYKRADYGKVIFLLRFCGVWTLF